MCLDLIVNTLLNLVKHQFLRKFFIIGNKSLQGRIWVGPKVPWSSLSSTEGAWNTKGQRVPGISSISAPGSLNWNFWLKLQCRNKSNIILQHYCQFNKTNMNFLHYNTIFLSRFIYDRKASFSKFMSDLKNVHGRVIKKNNFVCFFARSRVIY